MNSFEDGFVVDFALVIGADILTNLLYVQLCEFAFGPLEVVQKTSVRSAQEFLNLEGVSSSIPKLVLIDLDGLEDEFDAIWQWHIVARQTYGKKLRVVYLTYGKINYLFPANSVGVFKPITAKAIRLSALLKMPDR
jgi:hypothetical protein